MRCRNLSILTAGLLVLWAAQSVRAEPYLAVRTGLKCVSCHVNPTGGGLRNDYGLVFAKTLLPAHSLPADTPDWTGRISDWLRVGGDVRASAVDTEIPHRPSRQEFSLDQARLYAALNLIPDKLGIVLDELVAPGSSQAMEVYVRYGNPAQGWYLKGGKFYLPFGWRLQDNTAFVREVSGINMAIPDTGLEVGFEAPKWSGQLDLTNAEGTLGAHPQATSDHAVTGQLVRIESFGRLGVAASFAHTDLGNRREAGVFAGTRTGPVVWLGEFDWVKDEDFPNGAFSQTAALAEADWEMRRGHNLKFTAELVDPDRDTRGDTQKRWSVVYELTPISFVQLRAGWRRYDGDSQVDFQNTSLVFLELHGFF